MAGDAPQGVRRLGVVWCGDLRLLAGGRDGEETAGGARGRARGRQAGAEGWQEQCEGSRAWFCMCTGKKRKELVTHASAHTFLCITCQIDSFFKLFLRAL